MSKRLLVLICSIFLIVPLIFMGCGSGDTGSAGATGAPGADGGPGADGAPGGPGADGADGLGLFAAVNKNLVVNTLTFGVDGSGFVTASFSLTDGTDPVTGLTAAKTTLYFAGLIPGTTGDSDEWQYWTGVAITSLVESPAGTYLVTSNRLATAAPAGSTKQRGILRITSLTGYNPINQSYDFLIAAPGTAVARGKDVVSDAACKECHGFGVTIHSYGRNDTKTCVVCHSPNYNGTMVSHEADLVTMIHKIHTNKADVLGALHVSGHGENWPDLVYPGTMLNCAKCHKNAVEADNWKTRPTQTACKSCHTGIKFDGTLSTAIDNVLRTFTHFQTTTNQFCAGCHSASTGALNITDSHKPVSSQDATQRTMTSTIDNVVVDASGGVTVTFRVFDGGVAVTDSALFADGSLTFNLAKLVASADGRSSYWQSYLSRIRTKDAGKPPVLQSYNEVYTSGTLTNLTGGVYTYKFGLLNASTPGDIRTIDHVHNVSTIAGAYSAASLPTMLYPVDYEPALTHRVAMTFRKVAGQIDNKTNAFFDWVPAGTTAETRNIVSRDACSKCHGDNKLHRGYAVELCVGCHNKNSYDPFSGIGTPTLATTDTALPGSSSVILERLVHKVHMGKNLVNGYSINGEDFSFAQYPSGVWSSSSTPNPSNCTVCHDESNVAMTDAARWRTKPTSSACGTCHDSVEALLHIGQNSSNGDSCVVCHTAGKLAPVEESHGLK